MPMGARRPCLRRCDGNIITSGRLVLVRKGLVLTTANTTGATGSGGASLLSNISLFGHGQSNAVYANDQDGALLDLAQAISAYLGGTGMAAKFSGLLDVGGAGVYAGVSGWGSSPHLWRGPRPAASAAGYTAEGAPYPLDHGADGSQKAQTLAGIIYWGETDSALTAFSGSGGLGYADKPVYKAALLNDVGQIRGAFGKTAARDAVRPVRAALWHVRRLCHGARGLGRAGGRRRRTT